MPARTPRQKPLHVFYSYAHEDEKLRDALGKYLTLIKQQGLIKEWHDRRIGAGEKWEDTIDDHLDAADIILLLISVDFISSEYCWGKEMTQALERHNTGTARVIPIIIRPVDWSGAPFASLQALPKDGKPVTLWSNKEVAWVDVAKGIKQAAEALLAGQPAERSATPQPIVPSLAVAAAAPPARQLPQEGVGRLLRRIYDGQNGTELPGQLIRSEGDPAAGDAAVDEAYDGLGAAYRFFWEVYGWDSIDGKGMPLEATVHYGRNYVNAFWNGKQMISGDGDGKIFNRFTIAVDVIGKEFANGVVQAQSRLEYWEQSGAVFNSVATVFAALIKQYTFNQTADQADWLVGAGLFNENLNAKALYSLANPGTAYDDPALGKDPQPGHLRDYVKAPGDNGGVHINSGIPNRAFYLLATAIGGYAWEKAGRIWYQALRDKKLQPGANFRDFAQLTLGHCHRLYGRSSDEAQMVRRAWELVGIKISTARPEKSKGRKR